MKLNESTSFYKHNFISLSDLLLSDFLRKNFLNIWLIVFFTISPILLFAQNERFFFHQLTPEEGLSQASNDFIYHDSKGFIWLSSIDGLNRFDGKSVKVYKSISGDSTSLLGNIVTSNFFEDSASNLWFTTYEGIHCYVRAQDNFQHFQLKNETGEFLKQDYYGFHLDHQGQLWVRVGIGNTGKLFLFDIKEFSAQYVCEIDGQRQNVILDENEKVSQVISYHFGNREGIEVKNVRSPFDKKSYFADDNNVGMPQTRIYHINIISKEEWYLSTELGLIKFIPSSNNFEIYNTHDKIQLNTIRSTLSIDNNTLWVACGSQGIIIFNKKSKTFTGRIPHEPQRKLGLQLPFINKLFKDQEENIWITSRNSGVNFTNLKKQKFITPSDLLDKDIFAIYERKTGEIFCSYKNDSIAYFKNTQASIKHVPTIFTNGKRKQRIIFFFEDNNELWASTNSNLLKWNSEKDQFEYIQDLPSFILYVYKNQKGEILLATYNGILKWKKNKNKISTPPFLALGKYQKELATAIYEDQKGNLYLSLDASRLLVLKPDGNTYVEHRQIQGIGYAKDFYETQQDLWVATSTGILKINTETLTSQLLNELNDGAPSENYYCILPDEFDSFWLSCNRGIIRYFPKEKRYRRYTLMDGLQANEYNTNAFLKTSSGEIWMGGTKGLNRFFPNHIQDILSPPQIQMTQLRLNDEIFKTKKQVGEIEELNLEYHNNTISFDFVALEYSDPKNNQLQYQLVNHDEGWVDAGKIGFARYPNLPSGDYLFKVRGANADGIWNEEPKQIKIHVQTPWWQTWWFYLSCILFVTSIIYGVSRYQLQQALKIERMRVKISSDLHDDVGGLLAGLMMQTDLLEIKGPAELKPKFQRISELSRKAMSRMRDTVWAIDARKDKLENLLDRIREHALETLELKNIEFNLKVEDISLEKNMSSNVRQNIYLICKEAITNAAKHSNGDRLNIKFEKLNRNQILLSIQDNGTVKEKEYQSAGLGMSNMEMRAKQINATLKIRSENGFLIQLFLKSDFKG